MALPKAIQEQIDAADQIVAGISGAVPSDMDTRAANDQQEQIEQSPQGAVSQVVSQPQAPQGNEAWEARFHSLRGKYDAEVPRMAQQLKEQNNALQVLLAENGNLKQSHASGERNALVTDADREAFGTDLVDLVDRVAKQNTLAFQQELAQLKGENAQLMSQMGRVDQEVGISAKDRYQQTLTRLAPDWESKNQHQPFLVWLGALDPVFGVARQTALDNAFNKLDAQATAAIFNAFQTPGVKRPRTPQEELQSQVAPTRSRATSAPVVDDGSNAKIWTDSEINRFYSEARRGSIDSAEAERIEQEINRAVSEGRVRM